MRSAWLCQYQTITICMIIRSTHRIIHRQRVHLRAACYWESALIAQMIPSVTLQSNSKRHLHRWNRECGIKKRSAVMKTLHRRMAWRQSIAKSGKLKILLIFYFIYFARGGLGKAIWSYHDMDHYWFVSQNELSVLIIWSQCRFVKSALQLHSTTQSAAVRT